MSYCGVTGELDCKCVKQTPKVVAVQIDLKSALRKLFTDHGVWTKFVLNAIVDGTADVNAGLARLMRNQEDIGNAVAMVAGQEYGSGLTVLLKQHISLAGDVMKAAVANDPQLQTKIDLLFANSILVGRALSILNPVKLPVDEMVTMFNRHNQFVIEMTTSRIAGKYEDEVRLFDGYYNELLELSDALFHAL
jgi:hypothetical protein